MRTGSRNHHHEDLDLEVGNDALAAYRRPLLVRRVHLVEHTRVAARGADVVVFHADLLPRASNNSHCGRRRTRYSARVAFPDTQRSYLLGTFDLDGCAPVMQPMNSAGNANQPCGSFIGPKLTACTTKVSFPATIQIGMKILIRGSSPRTG